MGYGIFFCNAVCNKFGLIVFSATKRMQRNRTNHRDIFYKITVFQCIAYSKAKGICKVTNAAKFIVGHILPYIARIFQSTYCLFKVSVGISYNLYVLI